MRVKTHWTILATLAIIEHAIASLVPDNPPLTTPNNHHADRRAPAPTSTEQWPPTMSEDPWQCITENITHYFLDPPQPTGIVNEAIGSYGHNANKPCMTTATNPFDCLAANWHSWCGFTTAVPESILRAYSSGYLSSATSFWSENSESVSKLATSCPVSWAKPGDVGRAYLSLASVHAECYLKKGNLDPVTTELSDGLSGTMTITSTGSVTVPTATRSTTESTSTKESGSTRSELRGSLLVMGLFLTAACIHI